MKILSAMAGLALMTEAVFGASGVDWYRWRGPDLNGIAPETGWQAQWPAEGVKPLWKASVGTGFSSFSVSRGRVYIYCRNAVGDVVCVDVSGK
jgi:hypothetical protein